MQRDDLIRLAAKVQSFPYAWPAPPAAEWTSHNRRGSCAGKHALLAEQLAAVGLPSRPLLMVGPLAPALWPDLEREASGLPEVHEGLTVETGWSGPVLVDVTWHPAAVRQGLPGTLNWDGRGDMEPAVTPLRCYAVSTEHLREQKEALRSRLYTPKDRARRDSVLAEIARRAAAFE